MTKKVDFFIVGAMRSGTSSLRDGLTKDPRLSIAHGEPMHFSRDRNYETGFEAYHEKFEWEDSLMRGEKSPNYSVIDHTPGRIQDYNPDAKIIWILRDPVKRAVSHHHHALFRNPQLEPLASALANGTMATEGSLAYVYRSEYHKQIRHWQKYFPARQQHIAILEETIADPKKHVGEVYDFLGLERPDFSGSPDSDFFPHSVNKAAKKVGEANKADAQTLARLEEMLHGSVAELEKLIGRSIPAWH